MSDRLPLPPDRHSPCPACGSERREYLAECAACERDICSSCLVTHSLAEGWTVELCEQCALKILNDWLKARTPVCGGVEAEPEPEPGCECQNVTGRWDVEERWDGSGCLVHGPNGTEGKRWKEQEAADNFAWAEAMRPVFEEETV